MNPRILIASGVLGLAAVAPAPALAMTASDAGIHDKVVTKTAPCVDTTTGQTNGVFTYVGPDTVWPPNHKYRTAKITLTDTDKTNPLNGVTVAVTGTHDQMLSDGSEMTGSGNTDPATDVVPGAPGTGTDSATTSVKFRGERSGRDKTGRTYTFTANGTVDSGTSKCKAVDFTATVPHDQGNR